MSISNNSPEPLHAYRDIQYGSWRCRSHSAGAATLQRGKVGNDFEAMFLRQTLENILPSGESTIFGTGTAGGIWRSMLADCVSAVIAQRGDFDLIGHSIQPNQDASGGSPA
jgi:hypothetical protein